MHPPTVPIEPRLKMAPETIAVMPPLPTKCLSTNTFCGCSSALLIYGCTRAVATTADSGSQWLEANQKDVHNAGVGIVDYNYSC